MADLVTPAAAFMLGAALAHANSCTVASAQRLVFEGRPDWLIGLGIAIGWAGLTMTAFAIVLPHVVRLPAQLPLTWQLIAGGVLLGIGATINQGCFLGSVARIGRGDLGYVFTLVGIAAAMALQMRWQPLFMAQSPMGSVQTLRPSAEIFPAAAVFLPFSVFGLWRLLRRRRTTVLALIVVGIAGGTVYACNPGWSYTSGLYRVVVADGRRSEALFAESGAIAVLTGVFVSAMLAHTFELRYPLARTALARLTGGLLMGTGTLLVPGGNDTLMLWAIPGLTFYGVVAYAVMTATITALLISHRALAAR